MKLIPRLDLNQLSLSPFLLTQWRHDLALNPLSLPRDLPRYHQINPPPSLQTKSPQMTNKLPPKTQFPKTLVLKPLPPTKIPITRLLPPFAAPNVAYESSLVEKIRASEDKTLKRLAPVSISESGRPRVLIPDEVFHEGAELHRDFIICYYNRKPPPFNQIQSVLNHMWGKEKKTRDP